MEKKIKSKKTKRHTREVSEKRIIKVDPPLSFTPCNISENGAYAVTHQLATP